MSNRKLRTVENLILITFPLVLFAGCAGNDVKLASKDLNEEGVISELQSSDYNKEEIVTENDSYPVSLVQPVNEEKITEKTPSQTPLTTNDSESSSDTEKNIPVAITTPELKILFFGTNIYKLTDEQREELQAHADYLKANPGVVLVINGHADERGTENYNQILSEKRALEISQQLMELGVTKDQLVAKGFGELVPMHTENNWDENRRVELEYTDPVILSSM